MGIFDDNISEADYMESVDTYFADKDFADREHAQGFAQKPEFKFTPKKNVYELAQCYGDLIGVSVEIGLRKGQIWKAHTRNGYWWLSRKGVCFKLRLTDAALNRLFERVSD